MADVGRNRMIVVMAAAIVAVLGLGTFVVARQGGGGGPGEAVATYLRLWERGAWLDMRALVEDPPDDFQSAHEAVTRSLRVTSRRFTPGGRQEREGAVHARFTAHVELDGLGPWAYQGGIDLVRRDGEWKVRWSPATVHPALRPGLRLSRTRTWAERAPLVAADGTPLTADGTVVGVGIEPRRVQDRSQMKTALQQHAGVDPARVDGLLDQPGLRPDVFVPVIDLREDRYAAVRSMLQPVPGLVFRRKEARVTPSEAFARHTLGRVGEVTAERLRELGRPYLAGDSVGLSGLEAAFERQLAGKPSGEVRVEADVGGGPATTVGRFEGAPPTPVQTTLDARIQRAADAALEGVAQPAALVAVDVGTGEVRGVASRPLDQAFNRALAGRYPPGSTFKVATTAALLQDGSAPDAPLSCPPEATVGGKRFRNFEGESAGTVPLRTAFAHSCNTAFVQAAERLSADDLATTAEDHFGFGVDIRLPVSGAGGAFPRPRDAAEHAAAAIGQARVTASPLHMATVAATATNETWRPPVLVRGGEAKASVPPGRPLDTRVVEALRSMMREVVVTGTGTAAAVPGRQVAGKTGTAEFGTDVPPQTHAWFVGFEGNLAFAVLVEGGGVGGRVAAPVAARFVSGLPR
jgi:cell division protein FtsI/penicillin-binding protein 2